MVTRGVYIRSARNDDAPYVTAIYNEGIKSGMGTFETRARDVAEVNAWLDRQTIYPVLVAEIEGEVIGFARLMEYRPRECYSTIAEFSIYLLSDFQGKGVGTQLLRKLLVVAKSAGFHKIISRIFTFNDASRALCRKCGFREVGIYHNHGQLNNRWLDVAIVECLIPSVFFGTGLLVSEVD